MTSVEQLRSFYESHLPGAHVEGHLLTAPCPFCENNSGDNKGKIAVVLNPDSFFTGYFRCTRRCTPGGFPLHFGKTAGVDMATVPGFDPDHEAFVMDVTYPLSNMNKEVDKFQKLMEADQYEFFQQFGIPRAVAQEMRTGYNGRYLVYPYVLDNGNIYATRCILPGKEADFFWRGEERFHSEPFNIFNVREFEHCQGGALFVVEGELNLLTLKSLGFPGVAVPAAADLEAIDPERFKDLRHVFLWTNNAPEARLSARDLARRIGFKARIIEWPAHIPRDTPIHELAREKGKNFKKTVTAMLQQSKAFSPFSSPERERRQFHSFLETGRGKDVLGFETGFTKMDQALDGVRGINIMGGPPKAGKSCFFMQISTEMARRKKPVIYYDFENGRQKIYLRTLTRFCSLHEKEIRAAGGLPPDAAERLDAAHREFKALLKYFRVVTDRKLTPDIMRSHIEFLKHETDQDAVLVVLDSLHKLPFKNLTERRTGIDEWLRNIEAIRDEQNAAFLVISELSRDAGGRYDDTPHLGSFKESGDIEYSADNAMVLVPNWSATDPISTKERKSTLWMVASRENSPGRIAEYALEFPYWRFREC